MGQAGNVLRVVAADAVTPIEGATVGWTTTNSLQLSACGGATSCSRITDQDGYVTTWLTPVTAGASTVTATLAPGVYSPAKSVSATLNVIHPVVDRLVPELGVLRLQHPVAFVREVEHLRRHVQPLQAW